MSQYAHGPRGELTSVTQPDGTLFTYGRNEFAELSSITVSTGPGNPAEAVPSQTFDHDHLGRETRRTRGTTVWTTSWASGRGTTTRSGGSDQVSLVLDGRGRVLARRFVNGAESVAGHTSIAYAYDGLGDLMQAVEQGADGTTTTVFRHDDPRGLLTRIEREGAPAVVYGRRPTSGDVESVTVGSSSVTYGFDGFGRVSSIDGAAGTVSVGWEAGGARIESLSGGGLHEKRCYDGAGRLTEVLNATAAVLCGAVGPEVVAGYAYGYQGDAGARGNRTSETITTEGAAPQTTTFGYDAADRLTGVQYPDRAVLYRLAADGTRLAEKAAPDVADLGPAGWASMVATTEHVAYHYDGRGGLTSLTDELSGGATIATWTVDAAGRVTSETRGGTTKTYGWDAEGRLRDVTLAPPAPALPYTVSYAYDHAGRRVRKSGPGGVSTYLWGGDELVTETPAGGSTVVYQRLGDVVVGIGGERVLHDGLGSVVGRATTYGVPTQYRYDAWGGFRGDARPRAAAPSLAYAGQHWDEEVGLSYAQQRWMDPATGRFLSEDPVGAEAYLTTPTELAPFLYARGNPLQFKDPLGLGTFCEDRYGTSDTTICAARSTQQYQFERQLQAEREGNGPVAAEAKQLWRQAAKDEQSRTQFEDFHRNVFQPVFFTAVSAAPGAQLGMAVPLIGKGLLVAGTFAASYKGTEVATGEKTELLAKGGPRVVPYKACTDLMTCDRFWDGVSAGSELLLSFAGGAAMTRAEGGRLFTGDRAEGAATWLEGQLSREVEITLPPLRDEVTGAELVYSNPLPRVRLKGPSGRVSTERYLENNWDPATFPSVRKSIDYHVRKHGKGLSEVEYTQRGVKAFGDENAVRTKSTDLLGRPALRVQSDLGSGLFTPQGRIIWFHPKL